MEKEIQMESALQEAVSQIIRKKYENQLVYEGYTKRLSYGIAFYDKKSIIKKI